MVEWEIRKPNVDDKDRQKEGIIEKRRKEREGTERKRRKS